MLPKTRGGKKKNQKKKREKKKARRLALPQFFFSRLKTGRVRSFVEQRSNIEHVRTSSP